MSQAPEWINIAVIILVALLPAAFTYGMQRAQAQAADKKLDALSSQMTEFNAKLDKLNIERRLHNVENQVIYGREANHWVANVIHSLKDYLPAERALEFENMVARCLNRAKESTERLREQFRD